MSCHECGGQWMYSLSGFDDSGCPTCGMELVYHVSRECINCRVPQTIIHKIQEWEMPQEFSSPEFDAFFAPRWDSEKPKRDVIEERAERAREKEQKYQAAVKAAESFLPPEYRVRGFDRNNKE